MRNLETFRRQYRHYFTSRDFLYSSFFAAVFFGISLVVNFYAMAYATVEVSNPVTDLVLSNIPVFDVDAIFIWGPVVLTALVVWLLLSHPRRIPFTLKSMALFVLIRSVFITLTHIGPFPTHVVFSTAGIAGYLTSVNDLFFSGHTGFPFLLALIFWDYPVLRVLLIGVSLFFGAIVLMGHLHYSIDVLSAFFITYTIYHIAAYLFSRDRELFATEPPV